MGFRVYRVQLFVAFRVQASFYLVVYEETPRTYSRAPVPPAPHQPPALPFFLFLLCVLYGLRAYRAYLKSP